MCSCVCVCVCEEWGLTRLAEERTVLSHVNANIHEGVTAHQNLHWVLSSTGLTCGHNRGTSAEANDASETASNNYQLLLGRVGPQPCRFWCIPSAAHKGLQIPLWALTLQMPGWESMCRQVSVAIALLHPDIWSVLGSYHSPVDWASFHVAMEISFTKVLQYGNTKGIVCVSILILKLSNAQCEMSRQNTPWG